MVSLSRFRAGCFLTNFNLILNKISTNLQQNQKTLFHISGSLNGKGQEIKMPSLSPTMVEGKIVKWLKKEGDTISPGDVLCDIETDKAVVSFEIEEEGVLAKILVPESTELIKVGSLIALLADEGEDWKNVDGIQTEDSDSVPDSSIKGISSTSGLNTPSAITIKMPSLSPTMTSGTIIKWAKKEGDLISPGDILCDIQTDKAVMSLETEEEGILAKIIVPDNSNEVKIGTVIGLIVGEGEDWKNVSFSLPEENINIQPLTGSADGHEDGKRKCYGPAVKVILDSYQLKPDHITATGKKNRLLKEDVLNYIETNKLDKKPPKLVAAPKQKIQSTSTKSAKLIEAQTQRTDLFEAKTSDRPPKYIDIELTNMRQIIAERLSESKREIPHSYSSIACNVGKLLEAKNKLLEKGTKISINDLLTKSVALALQLYPKANAHYINNEVQIQSNIDVCVAVATKSGLYTPIIKSTNSKSVVVISQEIQELASRAKLGKLKPNEFLGGTFTISNLGMYKITHFKAIINPPQCGILAVGNAIERLDSDLKVQKQLILSLSYDRRALEEHEAAEFMSSLKYIIENPSLITLDDFSSLRNGL